MDESHYKGGVGDHPQSSRSSWCTDTDVVRESRDLEVTNLSDVHFKENEICMYTFLYFPEAKRVSIKIFSPSYNAN